MAEEPNVERDLAVARRVHEAFNVRDMDALVADLAPDVEWFPLMARLEGAVYRGVDQVIAWIRDLDKDWAEFRTCPREFTHIGDAVLAAGTWEAVARTSGLRLDAQPAMWLSHFRDGKVIRHETFTDPDEAYRAAGLEPPRR